MSRYPMMQVDAFTDRPLGGNPCAVIFDADDLSDESMLAIAKEMNLSETAFVRRSDEADYAVRYFTPAEEIPMAGHPTIATTFALFETGRLRAQGERAVITLELQVGPLPVEVYFSGPKIDRIVMTQRKPAFFETYEPAEMLPIFGLSPQDVLPGAPVQVVSTGTPQLMVALRDLDALRRARPDPVAYQELRRRVQFFSSHLFCLQGITAQGDTFARHFSPPPDIFEDPFTGSASGGMGAYLWRHGLIERPRFTAEQGHWMGRPGIGTVEVIGPPEDIETVKVGGSAVPVLLGELFPD